MKTLDVQEIERLEYLPEDELVEKIRVKRKELGSDVCLLAHLYQRKKITELSDFIGDSYGLSKSAASFEGGKYIVFCGVRFMAESACILARDNQVVIHPEPEAGCPMADMANLETVTHAWNEIKTLTAKTIIPVTYMNSSADIKAFCGKYDGTICTSSNAAQTFSWAFDRGEKIFFLPDEHLGRNTALKYGIKPSEIAVWNPFDLSQNDSDEIANAKVVLWRGYCPVHQKFTKRDIDQVRKFYPNAQVIVHPECPTDVVNASDGVGSTEFIRQYVAKSKPGDQIFIGTEINLVQNLASEYPDRMITKLHRSLCLTMYQITLARLFYALDNLESFEQVYVEAETKKYARIALDRMLSI